LWIQQIHFQNVIVKQVQLYPIHINGNIPMKPFWNRKFRRRNSFLSFLFTVNFDLRDNHLSSNVSVIYLYSWRAYTMLNQFLFYSWHVHNVQPVIVSILQLTCPQCSTSDSVYSTADMSLALYIPEIRLLLGLSFWHWKTSNNIYVMSGNLSPITTQSNTRQLIILTKSDKAFICIDDILSIDMIVFTYV
jgi:hypothetical protein